MAERCPGIVMSSCSYKEDKISDEGFISRKLEIANEQIPENSELRILIQNPILKINTPLYKIVDLIQKQLSNFKHGAAAVPAEKKLHPPLQDDFDSLMINVPTKIASINVIDLQIEISGKTFSNRQMKEFHIKSNTIPRFVLKIDTIDGSWSTPLDVKKLVHTTCQLPEKPDKLLKSCYDNFEINLSNLQMFISRKWDSVRLINIPDLQLFFRKLLLPELWTDNDIEIQDIRVAMRIIQLQYTRPQYITLLRMIDTLKGFNSEALLIMLRSSATSDMFKNDLKVFEIFLENNALYWKTSKESMCGSVNITNFKASLSQEKSDEKFTIFNCKKSNNFSWLSFSISVPIDLDNSENHIQASVLIGSYVLEMNESLLQFLVYSEKFKEVEIKEPTPENSEVNLNANLPLRPTLARRASRKSITSDRGSRKISHPEETIHFSSEKDEKVEVEVEYKRLDDDSQSLKTTPIPKTNTWNILKKIAAHIDINSGDVILVSKDTEDKVGYSTIVYVSYLMNMILSLT